MARWRNGSTPAPAKKCLNRKLLNQALPRAADPALAGFLLSRDAASTSISKRETDFRTALSVKFNRRTGLSGARGSEAHGIPPPDNPSFGEVPQPQKIATFRENGESGKAPRTSKFPDRPHRPTNPRHDLLEKISGFAQVSRSDACPACLHLFHQSLGGFIDRITLDEDLAIRRPLAACLIVLFPHLMQRRKVRDLIILQE